MQNLGELLLQSGYVTQEQFNRSRRQITIAKEFKRKRKSLQTKHSVLKVKSGPLREA